MSDKVQSRRRFVVLSSSSIALAMLWSHRSWGSPSRLLHPARRNHPEPRRGITAAAVLRGSQLLVNAEAAPVFDMVRQMPQIVDGIRCHCGCSELVTFYSLLSCFEGDGMAQVCETCQGAARIAYSCFLQEMTLEDIRAAVDAVLD